MIGNQASVHGHSSKKPPAADGAPARRREKTRKVWGYLPAIVLFVTALLPCLGITAQREAIRFDLEVLPALERYVELASYPPYLAIALQNNGFSPVRSGRIFIEDDRTVRVHVAVVSFVRKERSVYHYKATVEWSLGVAQTKFEVPVEVDTSQVGAGKVVLRVFPPLAGLAPEELNERIRAKLQNLASMPVQQRMADYFARLPGSGKDRLELDKMFHRILIDAYNLPVVAPGLAGAREPGDAVPLSDQWMFFTTLAIWLVILPGAFLIRAGLRRRRQKKAAA